MTIEIITEPPRASAPHPDDGADRYESALRKEPVHPTEMNGRISRCFMIFSKGSSAMSMKN